MTRTAARVSEPSVDVTGAFIHPAGVLSCVAGNPCLLLAPFPGVMHLGLIREGDGLTVLGPFVLCHDVYLS